MMVGGGLFAQTPCDTDGDGNPEDDELGSGEGADSAAGDLAWELLLSMKCNDDDTELRLKDYDPSDQCTNSSNLIPETGFNGIKVAIIDSGVRPTAPGRFNGHNLFSYTVKPDGRVSEGIAYPHPHGTYSAGVISGMLTRNSTLAFWQQNPGHDFYDYQVLNGELRTSLAAVVAAIDHAVDNGVDLISLSIGFVPNDCDGIDWE
ncbi:MAG: S8 family serine peptidase, partial [Lewinella sp.]